MDSKQKKKHPWESAKNNLRIKFFLEHHFFY